MASQMAQLRKRYREGFKQGKDVWYLSRYSHFGPHVWTKVDSKHIWKDSKYWYAFTNERWLVGKELEEFKKTHFCHNGKWYEK